MTKRRLNIFYLALVLPASLESFDLEYLGWLSSSLGNLSQLLGIRILMSHVDVSIRDFIILHVLSTTPYISFQYRICNFKPYHALWHYKPTISCEV
jgi:hypothetical protein